MTDLKKLYFPNLYSLRFFATLLIIICHVELTKNQFGLANIYYESQFLQISGKLSLIFFFVMSGYLITYLLYQEQQTEKKIDILKFYVRRILRIWPLYYLTILLAFLVFPHIPLLTIDGFSNEVIYQDIGKKIFLYTFFLPNVAVSFYMAVPYAIHLWSLGTEEQFYIFWPFLIQYLKPVFLFVMIFTVVGSIVITEILKTSFANKLYFNAHNIRILWDHLNFSSMAMGSIGSFIHLKRNVISKFVLHPFVFILFSIALFLLLFNGYKFEIAHYEIYSFLFMIIIINFAENKYRFLNLEFKLLRYLGIISFGLYIYHNVLIVILIKLLFRLNLLNDFILYPLVFISTIIVSVISYELFEKKFLRLKLKFSKVKTGDATLIDEK